LDDLLGLPVEKVNDDRLYRALDWLLQHKWIETGLKAIATACEKRRCDAGVIERRVGRLLGKNSRAAGLYDVQVTRGEQDRAQFSWSKRADRASAAQQREGCYKTLEGWSKRAGLGSSVTTILEEFARIDSTDVTLPATDGRTLRIHCVVRPDPAQSILLDRLGLDLPRRLRLHQGQGQMSCQLSPTAPCKTRT